MTKNQIDYQDMLERKRHQLAMEEETTRTNKRNEEIRSYEAMINARKAEIEGRKAEAAMAQAGAAQAQAAAAGKQASAAMQNAGTKKLEAYMTGSRNASDAQYKRDSLKLSQQNLDLAERSANWSNFFGTGDLVTDYMDSQRRQSMQGKQLDETIRANRAREKENAKVRKAKYKATRKGGAK